MFMYNDIIVFMYNDITLKTYIYFLLKYTEYRTETNLKNIVSLKVNEVKDNPRRHFAGETFYFVV